MNTLHTLATSITEIDKASYTVKRLLTQAMSENGILAHLIVSAVYDNTNGITNKEDKEETLRFIDDLIENLFWSFASELNDGCLPARLTDTLGKMHDIIQDEINE